MAAPMIIAGAFKLGEKLLDLGDQFIIDKDKKAEFAFEVAKMASEFSTDILKITTTPKVDALVKIMYASRDCLIPMLRPIGSAVLTALGMWAHYKGWDISDVAHTTIDMAFPAWMAGRQLDKHSERKEETHRTEIKAMSDPFKTSDHG